MDGLSPLSPIPHCSRDLEHHSTAAAPAPAGERNTAGEGQTDTHQSSTSPEPTGTAPMGQVQWGREKQRYDLCCLVTLQRSEDGESIGQGESYSQDMKQYVPVLALVTVSRESHQRSSAAVVFCFLNHLFIEGLVIQHRYTGLCFVSFAVLVLLVCLLIFCFNCCVHADTVCGAVVSPSLSPSSASHTLLGPITTEIANPSGQGFMQAAAWWGADLCRRPTLHWSRSRSNGTSSEWSPTATTCSNSSAVPCWSRLHCFSLLPGWARPACVRGGLKMLCATPVAVLACSQQSTGGVHPSVLWHWCI